MKQYIEGFPQTQAEHAEWSQKYKFDTGAGKWYSEVADQPVGQPAEPTAELPQQPTTPSGQSHMVASGDTLSDIATRYKTTVQELMAANPQISDPNMIYAGNTLSLPGEQAMGQSVMPEIPGGGDGEIPNIPTLSFNLDDMTMGEFNTDDLINIFSSPITQQDIDKLLSENAKLRQDYLNSMKPTEQEIRLKSDLVDLRAEIDAEKLAYRKGVVDIEQELVSMSTIMGGKERLYDQAQLGMQTLAMEESNLLTRLGMETESREATQKALGVAMEFNEADINRMYKMQDRIQQQKKDLFTIMSQFSVRAQNTLSIALDGLRGLDTGDLDANTIIKLQSLTKSAGIPFSVIQQALKVGKDEYEYDKYIQGLDTLLKEQRLEGEGTTTGAIFDTDVGQVDISTVEGLKKLKEAGYAYSDIYASLDTETKLTANAIKNLLKSAGFESPAEVEKTETNKAQAKVDLTTTIQEYKDLWKSEGDKNQYGDRESFIQKVLLLFPELTNGEILSMIDKELSYEWMEENKKGNWWNPFD